MKRNKTRNYSMTTSTELDYMKVIKIAVGVLLVLGLVYLFTALSNGEIKFGKKTTEKQETVIQYEEILAGETFNRKADSYYVVFMNFTDKYATTYLQAISDFKATNNDYPFYTVDLEKKMNKDYAINELKVENPTILKITNGNIAETISGKDNVMNFFNK